MAGKERSKAIASGAGGIGLGGSMYAADYFNVQIPPAVVLVVAIFSAGLLIVSGALWLHIAWRWIRAKGIGVGPATIIAIGLLFTTGGLVWGLLTWKAPEVIAPEIKQETAAIPERDPDAIYQLNRKVGTVEGAVVSLNKGVVTFHEIYDSNDLNFGAPFQYREYTLKIVHINSVIGMRSDGFSVRMGIKEGVTAAIVGRN